MSIDIAILGATGMVGETLLEILAERKFPVGRIFALASHRSVGNTVLFKKQSLPIADSATFDFSQVSICFSAVDNATAAALAPKITASGCIMIDKSSHFRYDVDVPLVVPEVNPEAIGQYAARYIIATPNCSTIPLMVALKPIYDAVGIERMNIATYQSVSGSGKKGIEELSQQVTAIMQGKAVEITCYPAQIAFNVLPHIDDFLASGYTKEEMKVVWESQKILQDANLAINVTAVRVPVFYGHSAAVHLETRDKFTASQARALLAQTPGVILLDEAKAGGYPTPIGIAEREDGVYVGRIRDDVSHAFGLNLWVVADNVRKGAALNAVQIAEILVRDYL